MTDFYDLIDTDDLSDDEEERLRRMHDLLLRVGPPPDLPAGLILTNDAGLAEKLDRIAFPGLTANYDAAKAAALAITLLDCKSRVRTRGMQQEHVVVVDDGAAGERAEVPDVVDGGQMASKFGTWGKETDRFDGQRWRRSA